MELLQAKNETSGEQLAIPGFPAPEEAPPPPAPSPPPGQFVHKGRLLEMQDLGLWEGDIAKAVDVLENPKIRWKGGPIPMKVWRQLASFFRHANKTWKSEAQSRLAYRADTREWRAVPMPQEVGTGMTSHEIRPPYVGDEIKMREAADADLEGGLFVFNGTAHSHCNGSAWASAVDDHDEITQTGLHVTFGKVNENKMEIHGRVVFRGVRYKVDWRDWFPDWPDSLDHADDEFTLIFPENSSETLGGFPKRWLDRCKPRVYKSYTTGAGSDDFWESRRKCSGKSKFPDHKYIDVNGIECCWDDAIKKSMCYDAYLNRWTTRDAVEAMQVFVRRYNTTLACWETWNPGHDKRLGPRGWVKGNILVYVPAGEAPPKTEPAAKPPEERVEPEGTPRFGPGVDSIAYCARLAKSHGSMTFALFAMAWLADKANAMPPGSRPLDTSDMNRMLAPMERGFEKIVTALSTFSNNYGPTLKQLGRTVEESCGQFITLAATDLKLGTAEDPLLEEDGTPAAAAEEEKKWDEAERKSLRDYYGDGLD